LRENEKILRPLCQDKTLAVHFFDIIEIEIDGSAEIADTKIRAQ
jgi:hypothetical protein